MGTTWVVFITSIETEANQSCWSNKDASSKHLSHGYTMYKTQIIKRFQTKSLEVYIDVHYCKIQ